MVRTALTALMVPRPMARTAVQLAVTGALAATAALAPTAAGPGVREMWAPVATVLAATAVRAATAVTAVTLMAAGRRVAMAVRALTAARRPEEMVASEDLAAMVATAAAWWRTPRSEALA